MLRSMFQVYVKDSVNAVELYKKAFAAYNDNKKAELYMELKLHQ